MVDTLSGHCLNSAIASVHSSADEHEEKSTGSRADTWQEMDSFHVLEAVKTALQDQQRCSDFVTALHGMAGDGGVMTLVGVRAFALVRDTIYLPPQSGDERCDIFVREQIGFGEAVAALNLNLPSQQVRSDSGVNSYMCLL